MTVSLQGFNKKTMFLFAALLFLGATVALIVYFMSNKAPDGYVKITGIIDHITEERDYVTDTWNHHAFVRYTYGGIEYINELDAFVGQMKEGMEIEMYVNPADPNKITLNGTALLGNNIWIFSVVCYACSVAILGGYGIYLLVKKNRAPAHP